MNTDRAQAQSVDRRVAALADLALTLAQGTPIAAEAAAARRRLEGPLRVAFAGRVKAGKSTLLNALVGERLAPTDGGECTRLVTVYQHGLSYGVSAVMRDGDRRELDFRRDGGSLAIDLGLLEIDSIERLEVSWPSSALRDLTLIDTPGLASLNDENSLRTREFFALEDGRSRDADAVIYLMRHVHRTDAQFLESFLDRSTGPVSPLNAIGVLSRADEIGAGRLDAMQSAARIADRYRDDEQLRTLCRSIIPVAGLLAETGLTLREEEASTLRSLAALDAEELGYLLLSVDRFTDGRMTEVPAAARRDILRRLGLFGARLTISELRAGRAATASDLSRLLVDASGLAALRRVLSQDFLPRARALQARTALAAVRDLSRRLRQVNEPAAAQLEREIERTEAGAHEFAELRLAHLVSSGAASLSADERQEVQRLTQPADAVQRVGLEPGASSEELSTAVIAGIERWRTRAEDPLIDPVTAEAASIAARSYEMLFAASVR